MITKNNDIITEECTDMMSRIGNGIYTGGQKIEVKNIFGELFLHLYEAPRLVQSDMLIKADHAFEIIQKIPEDEWLNIFIKSGTELEIFITSSFPAIQKVCSNIMLSTGLPSRMVLRALKALALYLKNMDQIVKTQKSTIAHTNGHYYHHASHLSVKLPDNYPSINMNWLTALALKRPVIINPSVYEPFSADLLASLLYNNGLPGFCVSISHGVSAWIFKNAKQVLWAGRQNNYSFRPDVLMKKFHSGQSKLLIEYDPGSIPDFWTRLQKLVTWSSGRVCTNVSSVLVYENEKEIAEKLAKVLSTISIKPLEHPEAVVPAFRQEENALGIADSIRKAIYEGAIDYSEKITGEPLIQYHDGLVFLRPTVLLTDISNSIYGQEFSFPFVTVSKIDKSSLPTAVKNSLIVSVIGDDPVTAKMLCNEKTIDKVFYNNVFDRGFNPLDTHEGLISDFLLGKKTVIINNEV